MYTEKTIGTITGEEDNSRENHNPLISIVVPAYNEEAIIEKNLSILYEYMKSLENEYRWELIIVNDGSRDSTGEIADAFAENRDNVHVLHHMYNFRLGQALRYAFNNCQGDFVVVMDMDLSYSPDHIEILLKKIRKTRAKIVIASPYAEGGKISNVPWLRKFFSVCANRFLAFFAKGNISTFTGMVRAYDQKFLSKLNLTQMDVGIHPEIIYKAMILGARIEEIPAHLDWGSQKIIGTQRRSSIRIIASIISNVLSGFIFRPFMFFILPGLFLFCLCLYPIAWALIHTFNAYQNLTLKGLAIDHRLSAAVAEAFKISPHSFIVGGVVLMIAIQLMSLGILSLQKKRYFEELFHLGSAIYSNNKQEK
jgi:glycosyltransferase involved in cell wall biosynthesis